MPAGLRTCTVRDAVRDASLKLRESGSPSPRLDAELLVSHLEGRDRSWLLAHPEEPVSDPARLASAVDRRCTGEPIAYIRGFKEWRSLRIRTDGRALIPRPETELLLDAAVAEISDRMTSGDGPILAWEVGTGTGAVAVGLALRFREAIALGRLRLVASDVSPEALELAVENLQAHAVHALVDVACADLLSPAGVTLPRPDVVVANLPYVPSADVDAAGGSLAFEPRLALDGGTDGLDAVRRLLAELPGRVPPGATVLLEVGHGQAGDIRQLVGAASVRVERDLAGIERVVRLSSQSPAS